MPKYLKYLFVVLLFTSLSVFALSVFAATDLVPCSGTSDDPCTVCHLLKLADNIYDFALKTVMAPLAGLLFLIGGIMMLAAGGSEERYGKGKQIIKMAAIGAVIALTSWLLVNALINAIGKSAGNFSPTTWYSFECNVE